MKLKHMALIGSLGANVALGAWLMTKSGVGTHWNEGKGTTMSGYGKTQNIQKKFRIACLVPCSAAGIDEVISGFKETITDFNLGSLDFRIFDANGSRTLMRSQISEILEDDYDLIYSLGTECTKTMREMCARKGLNPPVVFAGVKDPVALDIVESEQRSGNNFTGVNADHNMRLQMALLRIVKKDIKNVLVVYDPTQLGGYTEQLKREAEQILSEYGIKVRSVEIYNVNEIPSKVASSISGADLVLTLRDNTAIAGMEALSKICTQHNVTLFASDLGSLDKGAALAFGVRDRDSGILAAHQARKILAEGKLPTDIPVTDLGERYKLRLNTKLMSKQNLKIDTNLFFLMEHGEVL